MTEDDIFLSLIKGDPEPDFVDALRCSVPDWLSILDKAVAEGIFYPFYQNLLLLKTNEPLLADDIREKFRQTYYLHISQGAAQLSRVERLLDHLESWKIKTLLFKGPAIDFFIYDGFLRPRLDLDIAVSNEQAPSLEKALLSLGYAPPADDPDYPLPEYLNSRLFSAVSDSLMPVHLHKHLINNMFLTVDGALSMEMKEAWAETEPFKNYRYIYALNPELNIIYLCEHGLKHGFDQIVYLYELGRLLGNYDGNFNWKKLVALAEGFGLSRAVYYGIYFVKEVFSANIPQGVLDDLRPKRFTVGEKGFIKNILAKQRSPYSSYPVYLAMRRGWLSKANFVFRTIFPPRFTLKGCLLRIRRLILS